MDELETEPKKIRHVKDKIHSELAKEKTVYIVLIDKQSQ